MLATTVGMGRHAPSAETRTLDSIPVHSGFRRPVCQAYNEAAFRHFLDVECARAQRSHRVLYLVLVAIRKSLGRSAQLTNATADALFWGLGVSIREVDFVGWYREGEVAAAVLAQGMKTADAGVASVIADRVLVELKKRLSTVQSSNLRVRVVQLGGATKLRFS
jgi:hypothetical protein